MLPFLTAKHEKSQIKSPLRKGKFKENWTLSESKCLH